MNEKQINPLCIYCGNPLEIKTTYTLAVQLVSVTCDTCKSIKLVGSAELSLCQFCLHPLYLIATNKTDVSICSNPDCPEYSTHRDRLERGDIIRWKNSNLLILERWISFWKHYGTSDRIEIDSPAYLRLHTLLSAVLKRLK